MTQAVVRDAVEARWAATIPAVPLFASADDRQPMAHMPNLWATPRYIVEASGPVTFGSRPYFEERGVVELLVFGRTGQQGEAARVAAEQARASFADYNPTVELAFVSVIGPVEPDREMEGEFYPVQLAVSYSYQWRP